MLVTDQKEKKDCKSIFLLLLYSGSKLFKQLFSSNAKRINYDNAELQIKNLLSTMRKSKENMITTISHYFCISYISQVHKTSEYLWVSIF